MNIARAMKLSHQAAGVLVLPISVWAGTGMLHTADTGLWSQAIEQCLVAVIMAYLAGLCFREASTRFWQKRLAQKDRPHE
jgi:hypothetical protein